MKKNRPMRAAAALSVAVLATTAVVGGSFAKYHAGSNLTDSARAAKFGVTVTASGDSAFSTTYASAGKETLFTETNSVISASDSQKVIAPGTSGTLGSYSISGKPEVAVTVTKTADLSLSNWTVEDATLGEIFYCPIVINIGGTKYSGLNYTSASEFEQVVEEAISSQKTAYKANTSISSAADFSWTWAYEADSTLQTTLTQTDHLDTLLGNATKSPTISMNVAIDVSQID